MATKPKTPRNCFGSIGEARREVLALRKDKEEREGELMQANLKIGALEDEICRLSNEVHGTAESLGDVGEKSGHSLQKALDIKEEALETAMANERVSAASKEALTLQVCTPSYFSRASTAQYACAYQDIARGHIIR